MGYIERQIEWEIDNEEAMLDLVEFVEDERKVATKVA